MKFELKICQENEKQELLNIAGKTIGLVETLFVALKGMFKEYLLCTDKSAYIVKQGFMTGYLFGDGVFKIPYQQISNVEVDFHLLSGYFEISGAGLENKKLNYWDDKNSPQKQPNCISLGAIHKEVFKNAADFIMDMIHKSKDNDSTHSENVKTKSIPEQIKEYKELLDIGAITQDEFDKKKKELLC